MRTTGERIFCPEQTFFIHILMIYSILYHSVRFAPDGADADSRGVSYGIFDQALRQLF